MNMKRLLALILLVAFITSGCTSYKYLHGVKSYGDGYVVSRNNTIIPEYTVEYVVGEDEKFPKQLTIAEDRFQRRRKRVDHYYKKMDILYQPVITFLSYPVSFASMIGGIFKLPFILVSDYRYEHNPKYRKRIDDMEEERKQKETKEREKWQAELKDFIKKDLGKEKAVRNSLDNIDNP